MAKGTNYMELGMFLVIGYVAWKVFLGDLVNKGIGEIKGAMSAQSYAAQAMPSDCGDV